MIKRAIFTILLLFVSVSFASRAPRAQTSVQIVNAANFSHAVAAGSITTAFSTEVFTTVTEQATSLPLPSSLAGVRLLVDRRPASLFFVSPKQINFLLPLGLTPGLHEALVVTPDGRNLIGTINVHDNAPGVFTVHGNGSGEAAATYLRFQIEGQNYGCVVLYATGVNTSKASLVYNNVEYDAQYVGASDGLVGLKQLNFLIPINLLSVAPVDSFIRVYTTTGYYDSNKFVVWFY